MSNKKLNISKKKTSNAVCIGTGLVALDVVVNGSPNTEPKLLAGGSCGNTLLILSFLGWKSYPIARLSKNLSTKLLLSDLKRQKVNLDLLSQSDDGSTPIIIHRILKDSENKPKHRYEFKVPNTKIWFPSYKPVLSSKVEEITKFPVTPKVFYIDRISRGAIDLAKHYKAFGALIFFEPSGISDEKQFKECLELTDILKFSNDRLPSFKENYPNRLALLEIETLGANGLLYRTIKSKNSDWKFLPALHIDNAIDTAGAGDWTSAGIIHGLFEPVNTNSEDLLSKITKTKLEDIIKFGQFLSALNCNFYGARGLMYNLSYPQIVKIYAQYLKDKKIQLSKKERGFKLKKTPFDFYTLL